MANKKYKLTDGNYWATDGVYDFNQGKTQREVNGDLIGAISAITPLDTVPTNGSTKGVTSDAVYDALHELIELRTLQNVEITDSTYGFIDSGISTQDYVILNAYAFNNANNAFHISNLPAGNYRLQLFNCVSQAIITSGTISQINIILINKNKVKSITV